MLWAFAILGLLPLAFMFEADEDAEADEPADTTEPSFDDPSGDGIAQMMDATALESETVGEPIEPNEPPDPRRLGAQSFALSDSGETLVLSDDPMEGALDSQLDVEDDGAITSSSEYSTMHVTGGAGDDTIKTGDYLAFVDGGDGDDTLIGGDANAVLDGGDGDDTITAGNNSDATYVLKGGEGADRLIGGDADDVLFMDHEDQASGGAGSDLFRLHIDDVNADTVAMIDDFETGTDLLQITIGDNDVALHGGQLSLSQSEDGLYEEIRVAQYVVAVLPAGTPIDVADIELAILPPAA